MGLDRLQDEIFQTHLLSNRLKIILWDLTVPFSIGVKKELGDINLIIHMAAETHVDNSIRDPGPFVQNNILSTVNLLEYSRELKSLEVMFYFSTDEVFGPALDNKLYKEDEQ